jgi:hypothetical protein
MARGIFSGGDIQFEFTDMREHELKQKLFTIESLVLKLLVLTLEPDENSYL